MLRYFAIYKPFGMLSQFTKEAPSHVTLADLYDFPKEVYPVGRLDRDSEGLLLLTNDKKVNARLLHPKNEHHRKYWVQVEGIPTEAALQHLATGVTIRINKKNYRTLPARVKAIETPTLLPERDPPIRFRKNIPDSWIQLTLTEGKNRQVRRMCAAVGFPALRLVRFSIEGFNLENLEGKSVQEVEKEDLAKALNIKL